MSQTSLWLVGVGAAAGGFVSGVSGFAYGLVALSLWSWQLEPSLLAPLVMFGSLVAQGLSWRSLGHELDWRPAWPFLVGGLAGIPIGVSLVGHIEPRLFRLAIGTVLVIYPLVMLTVASRVQAKDGGPATETAIGFVGGVLGGLAGLCGAVPALWATLCGWGKQRQRNVFQIFNSAMGAATLVALALVGKVDCEALGLFAVILPATLVPALLGTRVYRGISPQRFRQVVLGLLFLSGVMQLWGAL
jgi:uncharacterized membrane protein YfcA